MTVRSNFAGRGYQLLGVAILCALAGNGELAASSFDGTWAVTRSASDPCPFPFGVFTVRVLGSTVRAPGGTGSVSANGAITFPGQDNHFTGRLRGNSGSGTFSGRCAGSFRMQRR